MPGPDPGIRPPPMMRFTEEDFPIMAAGHNVYRRSESSPICTCSDQEMAAAIAMRLNRDNQVYPETTDPAPRSLVSTVINVRNPCR